MAVLFSLKEYYTGAGRAVRKKVYLMSLSFYVFGYLQCTLTFMNKNYDIWLLKTFCEPLSADKSFASGQEVDES